MKLWCFIHWRNYPRTYWRSLSSNEII